MGRADIDVRFRGHAHMTDGMRAGKIPQAVLISHVIGVAKVLNQLKC